MNKAATSACNSNNCTGASQGSCQALLCSRSALLSILYFSTENTKKMYTQALGFKNMHNFDCFSRCVLKLKVASFLP